MHLSVYLCKTVCPDPFGGHSWVCAVPRDKSIWQIKTFYLCLSVRLKRPWNDIQVTIWPTFSRLSGKDHLKFRYLEDMLIELKIPKTNGYLPLLIYSQGGRVYRWRVALPTARKSLLCWIQPFNKYQISFPPSPLPVKLMPKEAGARGDPS